MRVPIEESARADIFRREEVVRIESSSRVGSDEADVIMGVSNRWCLLDD